MALPKFLLPKQADQVGVKCSAQRETNCGNTIAEIGGKICGNCGNAIAENGRGKKIVVAEIWGGIKKKKCYIHNIFTTFSQQITGD